mmetsp:Transcript_17713/g.41178  ORF Transcript_17713/g.41178 Transcript_17713/m.41178 type:complete len:709 (+) Transcript_17713:291-2417(+)
MATSASLFETSVAIRDGSLEIQMQGKSLDDSGVEKWCSWAMERAPALIQRSNISRYEGFVAAKEVNFSNNQLGDRGVLSVLRVLYRLRIGVRVLKFFKNNLGRAAASALMDFITRTPVPAYEIHLSHNYIPREGAVDILKAVAFNVVYPPDKPGRGKTPLWLRLEQNIVANADELVATAEAQMKKIRAESGQKVGTPMLCHIKESSRNGCRSDYCEHTTAKHCPLAQITYLASQRPTGQRIPAEAQAWRNSVPARDEEIRWRVEVVTRVPPPVRTVQPKAAPELQRTESPTGWDSAPETSLPPGCDKPPPSRLPELNVRDPPPKAPYTKPPPAGFQPPLPRQSPPPVPAKEPPPVPTAAPPPVPAKEPPPVPAKSPPPAASAGAVPRKPPPPVGGAAPPPAKAPPPIEAKGPPPLAKAPPAPAEGTPAVAAKPPPPLASDGQPQPPVVAKKPPPPGGADRPPGFVPAKAPPNMSLPERDAGLALHQDADIAVNPKHAPPGFSEPPPTKQPPPGAFLDQADDFADAQPKSGGPPGLDLPSAKGALGLRADAAAFEPASSSATFPFRRDAPAFEPRTGSVVDEGFESATEDKAFLQPESSLPGTSGHASVADGEEEDWSAGYSAEGLGAVPPAHTAMLSNSRPPMEPMMKAQAVQQDLDLSQNHPPNVLEQEIMRQRATIEMLQMQIESLRGQVTQLKEEKKALIEQVRR